MVFVLCHVAVVSMLVAWTPLRAGQDEDSSSAPSIALQSEDSGSGTGAVVTRVFRGGPADKAGIRPGDIITEIAGAAIRTDEEFAAALKSLPLGRKSQLRLVSRQGDKRTVSLTAEPAVPLYLRLCDQGDIGACGSIGYMLSTGDRVRRDPTRAEKLLIRACDGADLPSCVNLGNLYENGLGGAPEPARAAPAYEKACDGRILQGCINLGRLLKDGRGVPQDVSRALRLYDMACSANDEEVCGVLGWTYLFGQGVARDATRARTYLDRACKLGDARSCALLERLR
jgi:TPR repeat protein